MRQSNKWYTTFFSFVLILCGVASSMFVFTACQGSDSFRPTSPTLSISQGKVYVQYANTSNKTGTNDSLAVFRADTGKFLWQATDFVDTPVADSTTVYTPTETSLIARDAESGKELWHTSGPIVPNAVIDGIVYTHFASDFSAFQANDGSQLWTMHLSGSYVQRLEVEQGRLYVLMDESFAVIQVDTGKLLWTSPARAFSSANGVIYLSRWHKDGDGVVDAVQASDGKLLWTFHTPKPARVPDLVSTTITSDSILCVNATDTLYGLQAKSGRLLWSMPGKSIGEFTQDILTTDGVLYIPSFDEGLMAVQAQNGQERWRFNPGGAILAADLDVKSGVIYATIDPLGPWYLAAVRADGSLIHETRVQAAQDYHESDGVVYQLVAGGIVGSVTNEKQHYTQMDLTVTNGSDGSSLWSTHFQF